MNLRLRRGVPGAMLHAQHGHELRVSFRCSGSQCGVPSRRGDLRSFEPLVDAIVEMALSGNFKSNIAIR